MIFTFFMLFDLLTITVLVGAQFGLVDWPVMLYHAGYLIAKGLWYFGDLFSWLDIIIGLWILGMIFGLKGFFSYIASMYFLYKFALYWVYRA